MSDVFSSRSSDIALRVRQTDVARRGVDATRMPNAGARAATARADAADADQAELLARSSMPSMKSSAQPFHWPLRMSALAFRQPPRDRQNHRPGEVGDRFGQHVRRVRDDDAA